MTVAEIDAITSHAEPDCMDSVLPASDSNEQSTQSNFMAADAHSQHALGSSSQTSTSNMMLADKDQAAMAQSCSQSWVLDIPAATAATGTAVRKQAADVTPAWGLAVTPAPNSDDTCAALVVSNVRPPESCQHCSCYWHVVLLPTLCVLSTDLRIRK